MSRMGQSAQRAGQGLLELGGQEQLLTGMILGGRDMETP